MDMQFLPTTQVEWFHENVCLGMAMMCAIMIVRFLSSGKHGQLRNNFVCVFHCCVMWRLNIKVNLPIVGCHIYYKLTLIWPMQLFIGV